MTPQQFYNNIHISYLFHEHYDIKIGSAVSLYLTRLFLKLIIYHLSAGIYISEKFDNKLHK